MKNNVEPTKFEPVYGKRSIICMIELDEKLPIETGYGDIDYLDVIIGSLRGGGIILKDSRILDDDDPEDTEAIKMANKIFEGE